MQPNQLNNKQKIFSRATNQQRIVCAVVFLVIAGIFGIFALAANGKLNLGWWLGPCGFKQRWHLPCPTCGMTTSALAFSDGKIIEAFYIQPAAGLLCCISVVIAFLTLFTAAFGVYFEFIKRFFANIKIRYIIFALMAVIAAGWAVTLTRALAANSQR
jgi:hypothetical protein